MRVTGTVQGVGFRPFVYRHAIRLHLAGFVRNDNAGVLVEVQGPRASIAELCAVLTDQAPPLAHVIEVTTSSIPQTVEANCFVIEESVDNGTADVAVGVDTGTCSECLAEIRDPTNRRFAYPFTNCTNCGPRYTIVVSVPYDRPSTTMADFEMCPACRAEYDNPDDRRFHAQPNVCGTCGPRLRLCAGDGRPHPAAGDPLNAAVGVLDGGGIVAVKGVGGFHLAVDAANADAVRTLRERKARDDKPFAVMVADVTMARRLVDLPDPAELMLTSPRRPIVLAPRRRGSGPSSPLPVAPGVAPGLPDLGVMLPYSPLHHLLMDRLDRPLVLTSGNLSDDPIAYTDDDAVSRLGSLVDAILTHDRPIQIRCDDSVVRAAGPRTQVVRRSRGFAPEPLALTSSARRSVLAVGAELKNTVSVAKGRTLVTSHHIGDLEHLASYRSFLHAVEHLGHLCGIVPDVVAHDLHPEYLSTKLAQELDLPTLAIQHHHAHVASCLVDHGRVGPVLGVAYDGHGYGPDRTLWGGEFLVADLDGYRRVGHLRAVPLPGGAAAIREPWRMAVAWAHASAGRQAALDIGTPLDDRTPAVIDLLTHPITPPTVTTSMGRLFDAVAALVTRRTRVTYEGQAAIELEALADRGDHRAARAYPVAHAEHDGIRILDPAPLVRAVLEDLQRGTPTELIAAAVHRGIADVTVAVAATLAADHGLDTVAVTGGVFQNSLLTSMVEAGLRERGLQVLVHRQVPPNDGGISIGQAAIAAHKSDLDRPDWNGAR